MISVTKIEQVNFNNAVLSGGNISIVQITLLPSISAFPTDVSRITGLVKSSGMLLTTLILETFLSNSLLTAIANVTVFSLSMEIP